MFRVDSNPSQAYEARNRSEKDRWLAEKAVYESTGKAGEPSGIPVSYTINHPMCACTHVK